MMKKIALLGLLVLSGSGCCRSWFPLFRGAPCHGNCLTSAVPACADCNGAVSAGYGDYSEGVVSDNGSGYYGGETIIGDTGSYGSETLPMARIAPAS